MRQRIRHPDREGQRIKLRGGRVIGCVMRSYGVADGRWKMPSFRQSTADAGVVDAQHGMFCLGEWAGVYFLIAHDGL